MMAPIKVSILSGDGGGFVLYKGSIKVNKSIYPPEAVLKAAYAFLETDYIHIDEDDN